MMFRAFAVAFFALLPFAPNVAAQTSPLVAPVPSITVQGDAATQVSPDQASTTVTIRNEHKDLKAAKAENDKKVAALLALTKKYNVANDKVQTAYTSLNPVYDYRPNEKPALRGYEASTSINVTLVETTKMAGFLNDVIASGIDQLGSVSFSLQDEKKVERHTLLKALKNAEEKATEMVGSVNLKLGRPLSIVEGGASAPPTLQYAMFEAAPMAKSAGGSASPNLPGGAIEVRRSVTVTYELQQP